MAETEVPTETGTEEPSNRDIAYGAAFAVLERAAEAYNFDTDQGRITFDTQTIEDPVDFGTPATAAFETGFADFMKSLINDPNNKDIIWGPPIDGIRTGGNPELWHNRAYIDETAYDFVLEQDGNIKQFVMGYNQIDGEFVDTEATTELNRVGDNPTRNLFHVNALSLQFLGKFLAEYASANNLPDGLTETADIDAAIDQRTQRLRSALEAMSEVEINDDLIEDITTNKYSTAALRDKIKPNSDNAEGFNDIINVLNHIHALNTMRGIAASRDMADYMLHGNLPNGMQMGPPMMNRDWEINFESGDYTDDNGAFAWEAANEFRVFEIGIYDQLNKGTLTAGMFEGNEDAMAFIEAQGWDAESKMTLGQFGALTRHMMVAEAADRHGIADPYSAEAKAAFTEDHRQGYFHKFDIELAFEAANYTRPNAVRAVIDAQRERLGLPANLPDTAVEFDSPRTEIGSNEWQEYFGQPLSFEDENGNTITVKNATLTMDEAVNFFFRTPSYRKDFGYEFDDQYDGYGMSYEELLARHGDQVGADGKTLAQTMETILSRHTNYDYYHLTYSANGGPGDFEGDFERMFKSRYDQLMREKVLIENGNMPDASPERDPANTPAKLDTDTPFPAPEEHAPEEEARISPTPEEIRETAAGLTMPSAALASRMLEQQQADATPPQPSAGPSSP